MCLRLIVVTTTDYYYCLPGRVVCTYVSGYVYWQDVSAVAGPCDAFRVVYDKLVIAVGATSNTFNTPGVTEHAIFLKVRLALHSALHGASHGVM